MTPSTSALMTRVPEHRRGIANAIRSALQNAGFLFSTALGLAIATEDTVLHAGVLDVWSIPGEGTCFRLTLPRRAGGEVRSFPLDLPPAEPLDSGVIETSPLLSAGVDDD